MPEISIIVPVYNVQPCLRACMGSLVGQTFRDIEIICVDDGSTDGSLSILEEYAATDARVRVLTQPNRGLSAARNTGLALVSAPFIMFCDSDDWYAPTMCEKMYAAVQGGADMAVCGVQEVADVGWQHTLIHYPVPVEGEVDVNHAVLMDTSWSVWNKIYRCSILDHIQLRFPDGLYFEDAYFYAVYTAYVRRIVFVPDLLYYYRRRNSSIMGCAVDGNAKYVGDHVRIANLIWLYHEEHGLVSRRLPYLVDTWLKLCSAGLDMGATAGECADMETEMIVFADAHIIPYDILSTKRLKLMKEHRWVGLHKHVGGLILSRCTEGISPKGCRIKKRYYLVGIPCWRHRAWLSATEEEWTTSRVFGPLVKIRDTAMEKEFYILGTPVYKISYQESCVIHRCFGHRIYRRSHSHKVNLKLSTTNFCPYALDDSVLLAKLRELGSFTYVPNPGNMGDMLIAAATFRFFEKHKLPYTRFTEWDATAGTVVYGGGGIWVPDYMSWWKMLLPCFKRAKRILILPSSFHDCSQFVQQLDSRFTVFCRDARSYEYLERANSGAEILLDHDMAFRMDETVFRFRNEGFSDSVRRIIARVAAAREHGGKVEQFLRRDGESANSQLASDMDISSFAHGSMNMTEDFAKQCAAVMLSVVDSVDAVITDRLHVGIASVLMGKEVYLMDNTYGKLSAVFEHSLSGKPQVHFVDAPPSHINPKHTVSDNLSRLLRVTQ